jgi:uncharacterized protein (DUF2267 family)
MTLLQADLFASPSHVAERATEEVVSVIRNRLHATLALVKAAVSMPWDEPLSVIREENAFRFGKDALPDEEAAKLWAEFDAEMNRLYAAMSDGH